MQQVDWSSAQWRKSRRSSGNGACVEVASVRGRTAARDSKNAGGPVLVFGTAAWTTFLRQV